MERRDEVLARTAPLSLHQLPYKITTPLSLALHSLDLSLSLSLSRITEITSVISARQSTN
jgi:hypothetical protein